MPENSNQRVVELRNKKITFISIIVVVVISLLFLDFKLFQKLLINIIQLRN